jgi:hypothetical protein
MSSMRLNAHLDISHHGFLYLFKNAGVAGDSLTRIHNAIVKCLFIVKQKLHTQGFLGVPTGKNPEDSHLVGKKVMQWVLLYLSISHDRCH